MTGTDTGTRPGTVSGLGRLLNTTTLYVVCGLGIATGVVLFTVEVNRTPDIEFSDPQGRREAGVSVVDVRATNTTDEPLCPEVHIAARDGDGNDLDQAIAQPVGERPQVGPGERVTFRAALADVDEQDYTEKFDEYAAYVWEMHDCP